MSRTRAVRAGAHVMQLRPCPDCGAQTLWGLAADHEMETRLDLDPLTPQRELLARLLGIELYQVQPRVTRVEVIERTVSSVLQDRHRPRPVVLPVHRCQGREA